MGFTFLTLAIYQAAAAWWGESEGSNSPKPAPAQQGKRWFMVPPPFHIALFVSCLSPSLPAVVRLLSPLTALRKRPYVFCQATFILCSLPRGPFLPSIIHHYSLSCAFCSSSLFFSPLPLAIMCSLTITCDPFFSTYISSLLLPLSCVTGLWGRWFPVHHQGDNHSHGKLQLPCLWLWRPLSDTCAAGEWSVVAHFLLTVLGEVCTKCYSFVCSTLWIPREGNVLIAFAVFSEELLKTVSKAIKPTCFLG